MASLSSLQNPNEEYFHARGVFRTWKTNVHPRIVEVHSNDEKGLNNKIHKIRRIGAWATSLMLLNALHANRTEKIKYWDKGIKGKQRPAVCSLAKSAGIYSVAMPDGQILYLVGRYAAYDVPNSKYEWYVDTPATSDMRVIGICEGNDWSQHIWKGKPPQDYIFSHADVRRRIIELQTFPLLGTVPNTKRTPDNPFFTLTGVAAVRIVASTGLVYKFDLYPPHGASKEQWIALGLQVEQTLLQKAAENGPYRVGSI